MEFLSTRQLVVLLFQMQLISGKEENLTGLEGRPYFTSENSSQSNYTRQSPYVPRLVSPEDLKSFESTIEGDCKLLANQVTSRVATKVKSTKEQLAKAEEKFKAAAEVILKENAQRAQKIEEQMQALSLAISHGAYNGKVSGSPVGKCCCAEEAEEPKCTWIDASKLVGRLNRFQCPDATPYEYADMVKTTHKNNGGFVDARMIEQLLSQCARSEAWQAKIHERLDPEVSLEKADHGAKEREEIPEDTEFRKIIARATGDVVVVEDVLAVEDDASSGATASDSKFSSSPLHQDSDTGSQEQSASKVVRGNITQDEASGNPGTEDGTNDGNSGSNDGVNDDNSGSNDTPSGANSGSNDGVNDDNSGSNDTPSGANSGSNDGVNDDSSGSNDTPSGTNSGSNDGVNDDSSGSNDTPSGANDGANDDSSSSPHGGSTDGGSSYYEGPVRGSQGSSTGQIDVGVKLVVSQSSSLGQAAATLTPGASVLRPGRQRKSHGAE